VSFLKDSRSDIVKLIENSIKSDSSVKQGDFLITRHRHRTLLQECHQCLTNFSDPGLQADLACEELRLALKSVQKITGHIDVEEVLDVLFKDFCIGK
jgi:tRNA modification GTPase